MKGRIIGAGIAACLALATPCVSYYEGMVPRTYADPVGIPTICYGHTGGDVTAERTATDSECAALLNGDLRMAMQGVLQCVQIDLTPNQAAALVSFAYNVGVPALCRSTLARLANTGAAPEEWCAQLNRWTYATKFGQSIQLPGLVKRRAAETALCLGTST